MASDLSKRPAGVVFNDLSEEVFGILERYTAFPWPVLVVQAKRCGVDPAALVPGDMVKLVGYLSVGVEQFTTPENGDAVRDELVALARRVGVSLPPSA